MGNSPIRLPHLETEEVDQRRWRELDSVLATISRRLVAVEAVVESMGGGSVSRDLSIASRLKGSQNVQPNTLAANYSVAAESNIVPGCLIFRVPPVYGNIARCFLATAAIEGRFATDVVTNVGEMVESVPLAAYGVRVFCTAAAPTTTDDPRLFLSVTPGWATRDLAEAGMLYQQQVGIQTGRIEGDGKCYAAIACLPIVLR